MVKIYRKANERKFKKVALPNIYNFLQKERFKINWLMD